MDISKVRIQIILTEELYVPGSAYDERIAGISNAAQAIKELVEQKEKEVHNGNQDN